ncbi:MAG: PKD domain-containing protein [Gemmatimonadota bacterium]|nr:PKD domain-containing protein [Gemmatimonadota bacterium]
MHLFRNGIPPSRPDHVGQRLSSGPSIANLPAAPGRIDGSFHDILIQLLPFPGGDALRVSGRSINNPGLLVGMVREPNLAPTQHGVIWRNGALLQDMGGMSGFLSTDPRDINDLGQIVGTSVNTTSGNRAAFLWQNGTFTNLGALAAGATSNAYAVNNTGTIVGNSNGGFPVRWVNGQIASLPVPNGVIQPTPVDVNDAGDIIGWGTSSAPGAVYASAFWRNGQAILLPPWPGATQTLARSINNNAEIVGEGPIVPGGPQHALKWSITTGAPGNTFPVVTLAATTSTSIRVGGRVTMRGAFTDPDNGPWSYSFIWGNGRTSGTTATAGAITATRTYTKAGTFNVRLIVIDTQGAADTSNAVRVTVR